MQKFLKAAAVATVMALVATAAFAADNFTAKAEMTGSIYGEGGFKIGGGDQQYYQDALHFNYSGDQAGGFFRIAMTHETNDARMNHVLVWVKPFDGFKVSGGLLEDERFIEQIDWWRTAPSWNNVHERGGIRINIDAIENLAISAALAPGYNGATLAPSTGYDASTVYYVRGAYNVDGLGTIAAAFYDQGSGNTKMLTAGLNLSTVAGLAFFENIGLGLNDGLSYMSFDTFVGYTGVENLNIQAWLPVSVAMAGTTAVTMRSDLKISYKVGAGNIFARFDNTWNFSNVEFNPEIRLGGTVNIDAAYLESYLKLNVSGGSVAWDIPFILRLNW